VSNKNRTRIHQVFLLKKDKNTCLSMRLFKDLAFFYHRCPKEQLQCFSPHCISYLLV